MTPGEADIWLEEQQIENVRLVVLDLHGVPRAKLLTAAHFRDVARRGHAWALPLVAVDIWQGMSPEEREYGIETGFGNGVARPDLRTLRLDTMLAAYLLDPAESRYLLADLLLRYAHLELPVGGGAASDALQLDLDGDTVPPSLDAARRALAVDRLIAPISSALDAQGLSALYDDIAPVAADNSPRRPDLGHARAAARRCLVCRSGKRHGVSGLLRTDARNAV